MDTLKDTMMQHVTDVTIVPEATAEFIAGLLARLEAAEKERDALSAELSKQQALTAAAQHIAEVAQSRANRLQAKIAEREKQEPVWFIDERGEPKRYHKSKADYCKYGGLDLLYALPGAKGE